LLGIIDIVADLMKQVATGNNLSMISKSVGGDGKGPVSPGYGLKKSSGKITRKTFL
jgi:hypothetical protein